MKGQDMEKLKKANRFKGYTFENVAFSICFGPSYTCNSVLGLTNVSLDALLNKKLKTCPWSGCQNLVWTKVVDFYPGDPRSCPMGNHNQP